MDEGQIAGQADIAALRFETNKRIEAIQNTQNLTPTTSKVYYVSNSGSDTNDGTSESAPFETIAKVNSVLGASSEAVTVCFKRGDTWRGETLNARSNLTVTAYGTGDKPVLMASPENGANADKWKQSDTTNIWYYEGSQDWSDVGNIIFNDGESYAVKIVQNRVGDNVYDYVNGNGQNIRFDSYKDLKNDLNFYHELNGYLYIYSLENPATRFESIEFATDVKLINVDKSHGNANIVIDNICFKYTGAHAVGASGDNDSPVKSFTVQNCEFYWIGGSIQYRIGNGREHDMRYGNAIEIYGACDGFTATNNYIYQVYDAGITVQYGWEGNNNSDIYDQKNVSFTNNVIENCNYSIEYFLTQIPEGNVSKISNFTISGNLMWNAGLGFCETRGYWDRGFSAHIKCQFTAPCNRAEEFYIKNNTMVGIRDQFLHIRTTFKDSLPEFSGNVFYGYYDSDGNATYAQGERIGEVRVTTESQKFVSYDNHTEEYLKENLGTKYGEGNKYYFIF
ncbi:MAG: hypothetical protein IJZ83_08510 [Clostridia bacterium]|nr:hypothetical protein [Clostridia bacterium]